VSGPPAETTFVLIAGGGPVGLAAAIALGRQGVPTILVTDHLDTIRHPKCNNTNARSMEHFRRLGVAQDIRRDGLSGSANSANAYVTRFLGYELGRLPRPIPRVEHGRPVGGSPEFHKTPEPPQIIPQFRLEPVLRQHAEAQPSVSVHYGWRLISFAEAADEIVATVEDVTTGERRRIAAQYLIGADGTRSVVRRDLGIGMSGDDGSVDRVFMTGTMCSFYIHAPNLVAQSGREPALINWIINREARGFMFAQDEREHWIVHYQVPRGIDPQDVDPRAAVDAMLGAPADYEIISGGPWTGGLALVADRYRAGRAFLIGDAAHLFTPIGAQGMNTGIGDAMNLTWKLAAVHQGWGGAALLESFEAERRPIGFRNREIGVDFAQRMSAWPVPENVEAPGEVADAARAAFGAMCVEDERDRYTTVGIQLGERYPGSSIVCPDGLEPPLDPWSRYTPVMHAGARLPHVWLPDGRCGYDLLGPGLTLIDTGNTDIGAFETAARARGMPLTVALMRSPKDAGCAWSRLTLVRPDHHVAWHGEAMPDDAGIVLDRVRGRFWNGGSAEKGYAAAVAAS
jgi:2-polyprenyl-6-methoxyphenol hydroxylase-like FAD-dependent oxidoreductase